MNIKPLSVNQCWQGRRFKTEKYLAYERETFYQLQRLQKIKFPTGRIWLRITAGLSNKVADIDNIAKPFIDILQKFYGFNDKQIYELELRKKDVKKGEEFIDFAVADYDKIRT